MIRKLLIKIVLAAFLVVAGGSVLSAQAPTVTPVYKTQEFSEDDGLPVLVKHLPEWEARKSSIVFATDAAKLQAALGDNPVAAQIDFRGGTEAAIAYYDAGRLLLVEYPSPQQSADADEQFSGSLDDTTVYRRIGNYNAFVFGVSDQAAANALLDQIHYEKQIQWLGKNPFRISAERAFTLTTADIFLSTAVAIAIGIGIAVVGGLVIGFLYFRLREKRRASMAAFSDAGGMTRLNLDGFTPADRLLGE